MADDRDSQTPDELSGDVVDVLSFSSGGNGDSASAAELVEAGSKNGRTTHIAGPDDSGGTAASGPPNAANASFHSARVFSCMPGSSFHFSIIARRASFVGQAGS